MTPYSTARFDRHQTIHAEWDRTPAPFFTGGPIGALVLFLLRVIGVAA